MYNGKMAWKYRYFSFGCVVVLAYIFISQLGDQKYFLPVKLKQPVLHTRLQGDLPGNINSYVANGLEITPSEMSDGDKSIHRDDASENNRSSDQRVIQTSDNKTRNAIQDVTRKKFTNTSSVELGLSAQDNVKTKIAKNHIAFLKVHKAASTTLQTTFFKYGYERNLSFALPLNNKENYFSKTTKFHEKLAPPRFGNHYDIVCNHGFFNYSVYANIMPNDSIYIAVVRDPFHQFISAVSYYTTVYKFGYLAKVPENKVENLIMYPEIYDPKLSYTMNSMARDFGFNDDHYVNITKAKQYLHRLEQVFDFVLIAEYFDESLVMMRRLLNWSLRDILYISKNVRGSEVSLSGDLMNKFKIRNRLDYMLYYYFLNRFHESFKRSEESIKSETDAFKRILVRVQNWCPDKHFGELKIDATQWNTEFLVTSRDCELMALKEHPFIALLKTG